MSTNIEYPIYFSGEHFLLHAEGALFWPTQNTLIVADLHIEKGSFFRDQGTLLPPYDTRDTLERFHTLLRYYRPNTVMCLGDSFHDRYALARMHQDDKTYLQMLIKKTERWYWIKGNHDAQGGPLLETAEKNVDSIILKNILFTHENSSCHLPHVIGHYHPKLRIRVKHKIIEGRCFVLSDTLLIMPSFGSYTGGLEVTSTVLSTLMPPATCNYFLLKQNKIWPLDTAVLNYR